MRRYMRGICVVGLISSLAAAGAATAKAPQNKSYSGTGTDMWNSGGGWSTHGTGSFNFNTSKAYYCGKSNGSPPGSDCQYISTFRGTYTAPCTNGRVHVTVHNIPINQVTNHFHAHLRSGNAFIKVFGKFLNGGKTAKTTFQVNLSSTCAARVSGHAVMQ